MHKNTCSDFEKSHEQQHRRHSDLQMEMQEFMRDTQESFEHAQQMRDEVYDKNTAALQEVQTKKLRMHAELKEQLLEHAEKAREEYAAQQAENREVQRQHAAMEMKESRQFGRHESLASDVRTLRAQLRTTHERFEAEHAEHQEVQRDLHHTTKTENDEVRASIFSSCAAFESFKAQTAEVTQKHDLALQRCMYELGSASNQLNKQHMSIQRVYAELQIPQTTMPTSWGSPQRPISRSSMGNNPSERMGASCTSPAPTSLPSLRSSPSPTR
jgi:hypothetical protein